MKRKVFEFNLLLYLIGFLVGLMYCSMSLWGDATGMAFWGFAEARGFDRWQKFNGQIDKLDCPFVISPYEKGEISMFLSNNSNDPINVIYQISISNPSNEEGRMERETIRLEGKERREVRADFSAADKIEGDFVLVRTYLYDNLRDGPASTKFCGVWVQSILGLKNNQIILLASLISIITMGTGMFLWKRKRKLIGRRSEHLFFWLWWVFAFMLICIFANIFGYFIPGLGAYLIVAVSAASFFEIFRL